MNARGASTGALSGQSDWINASHGRDGHLLIKYVNSIPVSFPLEGKGQLLRKAIQKFVSFKYIVSRYIVYLLKTEVECLQNRRVYTKRVSKVGEAAMVCKDRHDWHSILFVYPYVNPVCRYRWTDSLLNTDSPIFNFEILFTSHWE